MEDQQIVNKITEIREKFTSEISKVIIGQEEVIKLLLISIFSGGHSLIVGVPGLAKTLLVNALSKILDLKFERIQFTPDLIPADITGSEILEEDRISNQKIFRFIKGPIFTNILLADEINRSSPKTQAALLQAMQEYKVTSYGKTYELTPPFIVFATQNPIEQEGTYPLPEAQLDRFMFFISIKYPEKTEELKIALSDGFSNMQELKSLVSSEDVLSIQNFTSKIPISDLLVEYAVELIRATRADDPKAPDFVKKFIQWGAGPRAAQYLVKAAKINALLENRFAVSIDDIKKMIYPVLRHRIILNFQARSEGKKADDVINHLVETIKVRV